MELIVNTSNFRKKNEEKKCKKKKCQQSLADSWDKTNSSSGFLRPYFQNSFP